MNHVVHTSGAGNAYVRCATCGQAVVLACNGDGVLRVAAHEMPAPPTDRQPPPFAKGDPCPGSRHALGKVRPG